MNLGTWFSSDVDLFFHGCLVCVKSYSMKTQQVSTIGFSKKKEEFD